MPSTYDAGTVPSLDSGTNRSCDAPFDQRLTTGLGRGAPMAINSGGKASSIHRQSVLEGLAGGQPRWFGPRFRRVSASPAQCIEAQSESPRATHRQKNALTFGRSAGSMCFVTITVRGAPA
jgi:hypothetical protein